MFSIFFSSTLQFFVRVKGQGFVPSVVANGFLQSEADTTMVRWSCLSPPMSSIG